MTRLFRIIYVMIALALIAIWLTQPGAQARKLRDFEWDLFCLRSYAQEFEAINDRLPVSLEELVKAFPDLEPHLTDPWERPYVYDVSEEGTSFTVGPSTPPQLEDN